VAKLLAGFAEGPYRIFFALSYHNLAHSRIMAKLDAAKRNRLSSSQYACLQDRKLPINDAAHVRNARARFNQVQSKFCHPTVVVASWNPSRPEGFWRDTRGPVL